MQNHHFKIFTKSVASYIKDLEGRAKAEIDKIQLSMISAEGLEHKKEEIFESLYRNFQFQLTSETKSANSEELHNSYAQGFIGNRFFQNLNSPTTTVTELKYDISYRGGEPSILMTVDRQPIEINGNLGQNILTLSFYVQGDDLTVKGPETKMKKENLIQAIESNNREVNEYLFNKEADFNELLRTEILAKIARNKKKADDMNLF